MSRKSPLAWGGVPESSSQVQTRLAMGVVHRQCDAILQEVRSPWGKMSRMKLTQFVIAHTWSRQLATSKVKSTVAEMTSHWVYADPLEVIEEVPDR